MIISVASGKGGTGKTTIATNLAVAIGSDVQLLDCDVEEPNSYLFINPVFEKTFTVTTPVPEIDEKKCNLCGKCDEICQFKAIVLIANTTVMTFPEMCHSCGGCIKVCPENAIKDTTRELGIIQKGFCNTLEFVHGKLRVGETMSPPLITRVRSFARPGKFTIIDSPPGTSCPVIASMKGADFILLVTEPTPFGLHDLELAVSAVKILNIPCGLVINRSDIGNHKVKDFAKKEGLPVLLEIPFDRKIAEACSRGDMIVEKIPGFKEKFLALYDNIKK